MTRGGGGLKAAGGAAAGWTSESDAARGEDGA
jgi:hypothetical protein